MAETGDSTTIYRAIKPALQIKRRWKRNDFPPPYDKIRLLSQCDGGYGWIKSKIGRRLRNLASMANMYEGSLPANGYDERIVRAEVEKLEAESLRRIRDARHWTDGKDDNDNRPVDVEDNSPYNRPVQVFADNLRKAHAGRDVTPLLVAYATGCGAGEVTLKLRSSPPGGAVYVIEVMEYKFCESLEPGLGEDLRRCDQWKTPGLGEFYPVSGLYRYKIQWPNRVSQSRLYDFSNVHRDSTILLQAP